MSTMTTRRTGHSTRQKVGLVLAGLMSAANIPSALFPAPEGDAGPPAHCSVGAGHEAHPAFLPASDEVDLRRVVQRVEYGEKALARHVEDAVAALRDQIVDEDPAPGSFRGHAACLARGRRRA